MANKNQNKNSYILWLNSKSPKKILNYILAFQKYKSLFIVVIFLLYEIRAILELKVTRQTKLQ